MARDGAVRVVKAAPPPATEGERQARDIALLCAALESVAHGTTHRGTFWPNYAMRVLSELRSAEGRECYRLIHERARVNGRAK